MKKYDCNNCCQKCDGDVVVRKGKRIGIYGQCLKTWTPPQSRIKLAEAALAHPQSLHNALSSLPFKVRLDFYI